MDHALHYGVTYPYTEQDEQLLQVFVDPTPQSKPGYITDFLGVRTSVRFFPGLDARSGEVVSAIPLPDDSVHAEGLEYISLIEALASSASDEVCVVEVGAGWGPWICAGAVVARKLGKRSRLIATEMLADKVEHLYHHMNENGIYTGADHSLDAWHEGNGCVLKVVRAAASAADGIAYVPLVEGALDHGARPSLSAEDVDYRGKAIQTEPLNAVSLATLLSDVSRIDFLHIDVQGYERQIIPPAMSVLNQRVAHLLIGTHSRSIEGELLELLYGSGWRLDREEPCKFQLDGPARVSLEARTLIDGTQVWSNPALAS